jgi:hypothetical protein
MERSQYVPLVPILRLSPIRRGDPGYSYVQAGLILRMTSLPRKGMLIYGRSSAVENAFDLPMTLVTPSYVNKLVPKGFLQEIARPEHE